MGDIEALVSRITSDPGLAERLQADPEATLRAEGIDPTPELVAAVKEGGSGEELAARISKKLRFGG